MKREEKKALHLKGFLLTIDTRLMRQGEPGSPTGAGLRGAVAARVVRKRGAVAHNAPDMDQPAATSP